MSDRIEEIFSRLGRIETMLSNLVSGQASVDIDQLHGANSVEVELAKVKSSGIDIIAHYKNKAKQDKEYRKNK